MFKPFIDVLYSIAIGIGFTEFPLNPLDNIPGVLFFLITLFIAALDWYYYDKFEKTVPKTKKFIYYLTQIVTILLLSQLFKHASQVSLRLWIFYLIVFILIGTYWNIFINFQNYKQFVKINMVIALTNILFLIFYSKLVAVFSTPESNFRYAVLCFEILITTVSFAVFNKSSTH